MANDKKYKGKMIKLERIFQRYTDTEHGLTLKQISDKLKDANDSADRKTLYRDFDDLRGAGIEVESRRQGKSTVYYVEDDIFELAELKVLIDSVQASKFITDRKSKILVDKLKTLTSEYRANDLTRDVIIAPVKKDNESILYDIDTINEAINSDKQIRFQYFKYDVNKKKNAQHEGAFYIVSPFALVYNNENYYLMAYNEKHPDKITHFRVDRMQRCEIVDNKRLGSELFKKRETKNYLTKTFNMYDGTEYNVTLECINKLSDVVIDRFGKDITLVTIDDDHFQVNVPINVSPQFYGWVTGIGSDMKIVGPEAVVNEYKEYMNEIMANY